MPGILYLIPNLLGRIDAEQGEHLSMVIPDKVQMQTANLQYFIAENAKTTRAFLKCIATAHPLCKPLQEIQISELSINTDLKLLPTLLSPLLAGHDAGLISEAGVPAVADPGANLVRLAHQHNISVKPLVGPSSLLLAVMASGLNGQSFAFNGYLPIEEQDRIKKIRLLEERSRLEKQTQLFIETPYRNTQLLAAMLATCKPETLICLAIDLTTESESIQTRSTAQWKARFAGGKAVDIQKRPTVFLLLAD